MLETLFPTELRSAGIEVVPLHGTSNWQAVLESDALWRFTTAEVAVMFDKIPAEKSSEMQLMSASDLEALRRSSSEPDEIKNLARLVAAVQRQGKAIEPIANPLPDMLDHLDETAIKGVFPKYPGHEAADAAWRKHNKGRRSAFLRRNYDVEKTPEAFGEIAAKMAARGIKPSSLVEILRRCTEIATASAANEE